MDFSTTTRPIAVEQPRPTRKGRARPPGPNHSGGASQANAHQVAPVKIMARASRTRAGARTPGADRPLKRARSAGAQGPRREAAAAAQPPGPATGRGTAGELAAAGPPPTGDPARKNHRSRKNPGGRAERPKGDHREPTAARRPAPRGARGEAGRNPAGPHRRPAAGPPRGCRARRNGRPETGRPRPAHLCGAGIAICAGPDPGPAGPHTD